MRQQRGGEQRRGKDEEGFVGSSIDMSVHLWILTLMNVGLELKG